MNKKTGTIWLSSPHMGGSELSFIHEAFETNWVAPVGANLDGFEKDMASYTGMRYAASVVSGTAAIHLGLILLGIEPGDVVICQAFTFSGTANPVRYLGAEPVFVDSEPQTWNMCPDALQLAIDDQLVKGKHIKAIIPVHLYGMPAQMDPINSIANRYGIPILEDAAEALGSRISQHRCGAFGKLGVLSFNGNKIITTSGGGALLSNDEDLINQARFLATQARDPAPHYQHSEIGYNYRMSNIVAGIGRGQMLVLDERVRQRRANFDRYRKYFTKWNEAGFDIRFQEEPEGYFSNRWLTCILVDPAMNHGLTREQIRLHLLEDDIESRPLWKPMHLQPVFAGFLYYGNGVSDRLFEQGLCLPSGSNLTDEDFDRIFSQLDLIFNSV